MKRKIFCILVIGLMMVVIYPTILTANVTNGNTIYVDDGCGADYRKIQEAVSAQLPSGGWIELPKTYMDYAPSGLPDFSQLQDSSWRGFFNLVTSWCGPTAAANVLWYLDSKHENGHVGDNTDIWDLVPNGNYIYRKNTFPWKLIHEYHSDDHNEDVPHDLIECIADRSGTDSWGKQYGMAGTNAASLKKGLEDWISDCNLSNHHKVFDYTKPTFDDIKDAIDKQYGAIILFEPKNPSFLPPFAASHFVAVQGYKESTNQIKVSNPIYGSNNASIVSHDILDMVLSDKLDLSVLKTKNFLPRKKLFGWTKDQDGYLTHLIVVTDQ